VWDKAGTSVGQAGHFAGTGELTYSVAISYIFLKIRMSRGDGSQIARKSAICYLKRLRHYDYFYPDRFIK
jgi:hypothetical protein